ERAGPVIYRLSEERNRRLRKSHTVHPTQGVFHLSSRSGIPAFFHKLNLVPAPHLVLQQVS
ncbi:MAG TPA: hypothetical protein VLX29_01280, partial [Nitrospirota bacterium]|nr:hypothetical protein [Nitrospirota bacterium]